MCTVIIGYKLFPQYPIVIAANRDELLDRPAEAPRLRELAPRTLSPCDLARNGTWIGVNEYGMFAALTNRIDVESIWDARYPNLMRSRGELVPRALSHRSIAEAIVDLAQIKTRAYNGFNLIIGDNDGIFVLRGNGATGAERPERLPQANQPSLVIISNLGIGPDHSPRAEAIVRTWLQSSFSADGTPYRPLWDSLLRIHDPEARLEDGWMKRMASTCIHRPPEENYGTRSSAFVILSTGSVITASPPAWNYWHRERPSDGHACQGEWDPVRTLPIRE